MDKSDSDIFDRNDVFTDEATTNPQQKALVALYAYYNWQIDMINRN
jgi:hypothetical protein